MLTKNDLHAHIHANVVEFLIKWLGSKEPKPSTTSTEFKSIFVDFIYNLNYGLNGKIPFSKEGMYTEFKQLHISVNDIEDLSRKLMKMDFVREILFARKLKDFGKYYVLSENEGVIKVDTRGFLNRQIIECDRSPLSKAQMIEHLLCGELSYIINQENRVMKRGKIGINQPTIKSNYPNKLYIYGRFVSFDISSENTISFVVEKHNTKARIKSRRKKTFIRQYSNEEVLVILKNILKKIDMFTDVVQTSSTIDGYKIKVTFDETFSQVALTGFTTNSDANVITVRDPLADKISKLKKEIETKHEQLLKAEELAVRHKTSLEYMKNDLNILEKAQEIVLK